MKNCKGFVSSAQAAQELTGMSCRFVKALVRVGFLEFSGYLSECGKLFVRESDGSMCGKDKFEIIN